MKVKKMVLRSFAGLMTLCMLIASSSGVSTEKKSDKEIIVIGDVDSQKAQLIINAISGETHDSIYQSVAPSNIACIFGHSMAQTTVAETTHRYWATAPRCRRITYRVDYCSRASCSYIVYTQTSVSAIYCCA